MGKIGIDDILIYRGGVYRDEKDRFQIVTSIDLDGNLFTKFNDNDELNIINVKSGYFELCDIIPKEKNNLELNNGIPMNWDFDN